MLRGIFKDFVFFLIELCIYGENIYLELNKSLALAIEVQIRCTLIKVSVALLL